MSPELRAVSNGRDYSWEAGAGSVVSQPELAGSFSQAERFPDNAPVLRGIFDYMAAHFQIPLSGEQFYKEGVLGDTATVPFVGDWRNHLHVSVYRVREALPQSLSIYSINGFDQYFF